MALAHENHSLVYFPGPSAQNPSCITPVPPVVAASVSRIRRFSSRDPEVSPYTASAMCQI